MPINAEQLLKRFNRMKADHQLWEPIWQDLADYIHPRRGQFTTVRSPGAKQTERLFDSTALDAHDRLAATLNGTLTSRAANWFSLKMRDEQFDENAEVKQWLEDCSKRMFNAFNQSNFAQEIHEVYLEEVAFGTSGLFLEERNPTKKDFNGLIFRSIPLSDLFIDEDSEGRVDTVFRAFTLTASAAADKWGVDKLGEKVQKAIADGKADSTFNFLHAIYRRNQEDPKLGVPKTKLPWASVYVCIEDKYVVAEGGFKEFPVMVPRWAKSSGEKYGRGPGHLALPDIKTLNKVTELGLRTWAKTLDMPTKSISDGVVGPIRNQPGGNTIVSNMEAVQPLFPPGTFREAIGNDQIKSDTLKAAIRRYFYADQMELPVGPAMTAFEVAKRFELLQRLLGPTMGRQETELLNPLIERTFGIMLRHNAFPAVPQVLLDAGADIDVQYEGPLAKSQRLSEVEGIERLQAIVSGIAQVDPSVLDNINYDEAVQTAAEVLGVPEKIMRGEDEVQKLRQQRTQQQAQQQQKVDLAQLAESAGKAAPALKLLPGATPVTGANAAA